MRVEQNDVIMVEEGEDGGKSNKSRLIVASYTVSKVNSTSNCARLKCASGCFAAMKCLSVHPAKIGTCIRKMGKRGERMRERKRDRDRDKGVGSRSLACIRCLLQLVVLEVLHSFPDSLVN